MNSQLREFFECADDAEHVFSKSEVSHMVEVTTRAIQNPLPSVSHLEQWNIQQDMNLGHSVNTATPPLEQDVEEHQMMLDEHDDCEESNGPEIPYSTYQSLNTRYFIPINSSNAWQAPPHSRQYREAHADLNQGRGGIEKYMEIPPFKTMPFTMEWSSGGSSGSGGVAARTWVPACSLLMWCNTHNNFYEVHVLS